MKDWTHREWIEFATMALNAAMTDVARERGWITTFTRIAGEAIEIALELQPTTADKP
jgi:hypothetical protein